MKKTKIKTNTHEKCQTITTLLFVLAHATCSCKDVDNTLWRPLMGHAGKEKKKIGLEDWIGRVEEIFFSGQFCCVPEWKSTFLLLNPGQGAW